MAMKPNLPACRPVKGQMMTLTALLIFLLMFAELFAFVLLNIQYSKITESAAPLQASTSFVSALGASSKQLSIASAQTAASALGYYLYNSSLSGTGAIYNINASKYITYLITNGTIPVPSTYAYITNYGSPGNIVIINTATGAAVGSITGGINGPIGVAFAPSGTYAYVTNYVGATNVVIINTATSNVVGVIPGGILGSWGVAFAPSGTYAYVTNDGSGNVVIVNTATSSVVGALKGGFNQPIGVAFAPSGAYAYVVNYGSGNVEIVNTSTSSVVGSITNGISNPYGVAISPSGAYAYVANLGSANVAIINTATSNVVGAITGGVSSPIGIAFAPSGAYAYVTNYLAPNVVIVNTSTSSVVGVIKSGISDPYGAAFAPGAASYFSRAMGTLNFKSFDSQMLSNFTYSGLTRINQTEITVVQPNNYTFSVSYIENLAINQSSGLSSYSLPISFSFPATRSVAQFNGASNIITGTSGLPSGSAARSVFAWVNYSSSSCSCSVYGWGTDLADEESVLRIDAPVLTLSVIANTVSSNIGAGGANNGADAWHFVGYTYAAGSTTINFYVDGKSQAVPIAGVLNTVVTNSIIGGYPQQSGATMIGSITNVQVYNTALSSGQITALYQEGIGGSPISSQNLVSWWPLNGNPNDYGVNYNNGIPTNVIYAYTVT